jgi:hypothetical protein
MVTDEPFLDPSAAAAYSMMSMAGSGSKGLLTREEEQRAWAEAVKALQSLSSPPVAESTDDPLSMFSGMSSSSSSGGMSRTTNDWPLHKKLYGQGALGQQQQQQLMESQIPQALNTYNNLSIMSSLSQQKQQQEIQGQDYSEDEDDEDEPLLMNKEDGYMGEDVIDDPYYLAPPPIISSSYSYSAQSALNLPASTPGTDPYTPTMMIVPPAATPLVPGASMGPPPTVANLATTTPATTTTTTSSTKEGTGRRRSLKPKDENPRIYKCPTRDCSKVYKNPNGLKYHLQKGTCDSLGKDPKYAGFTDMTLLHGGSWTTDSFTSGGADENTTGDDVSSSSHGNSPSQLSKKLYSSLTPSYSTQNQQQQQQQSQDELPKTWYCKLCHKVYRTTNGLRYHARNEHPDLDFDKQVKGLMKHPSEVKQDEQATLMSALLGQQPSGLGQPVMIAPEYAPTKFVIKLPLQGE